MARLQMTLPSGAYHWFRADRWDRETFFGETMVYGGINAADVWASSR